MNRRGAYGVVWKALSRNTQQVVALKKCFDAFQGSTGMQLRNAPSTVNIKMHNEPTEKSCF
jgi:hypothetical protein